MRERKTLSIASDRRARIPFAVIGALLMVTSVTVVIALQVRPDGTQRVDTTQIFQQTKTEIQSEVAAAARQSITQAGEKPVTKASDTVAGRALAGGDTFDRYARLRFYLNLERRLDDLEREKSSSTREDVTIRIGVKPVRYNEKNISEAIERVEVDRTDKAGDTAVESVQYQLFGDSDTIPIVIYRNGHEIARERVPIETAVDSAVYDMHGKSVDFQQNLDSDLQKILYGALYGVTYAKGGIERVAGNPVMEKYFADIIHKRELHTFTDYGVTAIQQGTFDTVAEGVKDETGMNGACLATYYAARFMAGKFQVYPAPQLLCEVMKRVPDQSGVPSGTNPRDIVLNQANRNPSISDAESQFESVNGLNETASLKVDELANVSHANVTGGTYSPAKSSGVSSGALDSAVENYENFTNEAPEENQPWKNQKFEGQLDDIIEETYTLDVESQVIGTRRTGDTLNSSASHTVVSTGSVNATFKSPSAPSQGTRQRVVVSLPVTIEETIDGDTTTKSVTFESTVLVTSNSTGTSVEDREITNPYGEGPVHYEYFEANMQNNAHALDGLITGGNAIESNGTLQHFELPPERRNEHFGVKYASMIEVPKDGEYTFYVKSDDVGKVFIDGQKVVQSGGLRAGTKHGKIGLSAGTHLIVVNYYNRVRGELINVEFEGPGVDRHEIATADLVDPALHQNHPDIQANTNLVQDVLYSANNSEPSYSDAVPSARDTVFPGSGGSTAAIETALERKLNTGSITSASQFEQTLSAAISTNGTINHTNITTSSERNDLKAMLEDDVAEARNEVLGYEINTNVTRREMLTEDDIFTEMMIPESKGDDVIYGNISSGRYDTVPEKAAAEARKHFIDTLNTSIKQSEGSRGAVKDRLEQNLSGAGGLGKAMDRAENADNFSLADYGYTDPATASDGDKYVLRTTPDSFTTMSLPQNAGPMIKPRDEVREDEEPIMHTSLASRKITPLPNPGVPIIPMPNFWFVSVNYWNTNVRGEYASFSIEPAIPQSDSAHSQYVRQPQPVSLKINGLRRQVGHVESIHFEVENHIVGVMPGFTPMPKGSLGIGDRVDTLGFMSTCAGAWPKPGPGKTTKGAGGMSLADLGPNPAGEQWNIKNPNFDDSTCPKFNPLLTAMTLGTKAAFMAQGGGDVDKWINDYLRKKSGKHRPKKGEFDTTKLGKDIDSGKRMKGTTSAVDGMSKKIGKNIMSGVPLAMGAAEVIGLQILAQNPKYAQQVTCPAIPDEEGQSGCDDDRLEVEVFDSDDTSSITIVESERAAKGTDRVIAIDTSDGEPLPNSWRCVRENVDHLWRFKLIEKDEYWEPRQGNACQGGDLSYSDIVYTPEVNCFVGEISVTYNHPSGRVPLSKRNDKYAIEKMDVEDDCTSIFTDGYTEIDKSKRAWLYTGPKLDSTDGKILMEEIEDRIVTDTDLNDLVLDDKSGRIGLIFDDTLYLKPHDSLITKGELEAAGAYENLERREEPYKILRGNKSVERPFHRVVGRPEGEGFVTVNRSTRNSTELLTESPDIPTWANETDPEGKPLISKPADDDHSYVRTITYKDHTFLIALGDSRVKWNQVAHQIESNDDLDVDVLIATAAAYEALRTAVDPKSITVTSDTNPGALPCPGGDSATEIYVGGSDDGTKYRVSEEGYLYGPSTAPDLHCGV